MRAARGFGLLEALVALVLLAGTGAALFAWIGQNTRDASRLEEARARAALRLQALALLESVNPQVDPQGERAIAGLQLRWTSEQTELRRPSVPTQAMEPLRWKVALYRVKAHARQVATGASVDFEVMLPGLEDLAKASATSPAVAGP
ncbi:hypothetical protein [Roseateles sp.]|uniref:hypothetical protein n=1 Tax=Roseateles sp. TaxID=1971397 RepID=UPI0025F5982D|nr:hypothetical protein [Roseateles sp.]MBV8033812.1 hypothetical protein [Roseateles sp.]